MNLIPMFASTIETGDNALFREASERDETHYGNSWYYIVQAAGGIGGKKPGLKYCEPDALMALGLFERPTDGAECVHIVRPLGRGAIRKIPELAQEMERKCKMPIYVKNITAKQRDYLLGHGFSLVEPYPWNPHAAREDDTFPGQIIDIGQTLGSLQRSTPLSRKYRKFLKYYDEPTHANLPDSAGDARAVVGNFFSGRRDVTSTPYDYRSMIEYPAYGENGKDYFAYVLYVSGMPTGFVVADRNGRESVGVYANMANYRDFPGMSEFLLLDLFERAASAGYKTAYLGGSETQEVFRFKEKFQPVGYEDMHWVVRI